MEMGIGLGGMDAPTQTTDLWSRHMCFCGFLIARSMDRIVAPPNSVFICICLSIPQLNTPYIVCAIEIPFLELSESEI